MSAMFDFLDAVSDQSSSGVQMEDTKSVAKRQLGAMELLSIGGFSFFFGWMLVTFYWLFAVFLQDLPDGERDIIQLFIFLGIFAGYLTLHFASRIERFNPFSKPLVAIEGVLSLVIPAAALLLTTDTMLPLPVLYAINFVTGLCGASFTVSWLDISSRTRMRSFARFTSLSFAGGGVLFGLVALMPAAVQPIFGIIYALAGLGLQVFSSKRASDNTEAPPAGACKDRWVFTKEIEPSLIAFGIVFGLTFVYLFNSGSQSVLVGLLAVIPGAGAIAVLTFLGKSIDITIIQRVLLCVTVLACVATPFAPAMLQLACACLVVAAWAAFTSVNYASIVRKGIEKWDTPVFRQIPIRLVFSALGFLLGWGVATALTVLFGAHSDAFTVVRLVMAFVLVAVVMLFLPERSHHGESLVKADEAAPVISSNLSEKELFERRCAAIAELYQLSPRETDVLKLLARGRNAAYIQNKLTISPHTVKSHIYNMYRKMDIHSQQKLMDFVEDYPIDDRK